jgi:hypothetical protein
VILTTLLDGALDRDRKETIIDPNKWIGITISVFQHLFELTADDRMLIHYCFQGERDPNCPIAFEITAGDVRFSEIEVYAIPSNEKYRFFRFSCTPDTFEDGLDVANVGILSFFGTLLKNHPSMAECFLSCGGRSLLLSLIRECGDLFDFLAILKYLLERVEVMFVSSDFFRIFGHFLCTLPSIDINVLDALFKCFPLREKENKHDFVLHVLFNFGFMSTFGPELLATALRTHYLPRIKAFPTPFCVAMPPGLFLCRFMSHFADPRVLREFWPFFAEMANRSKLTDEDYLTIIAVVKQSESDEMFEVNLEGLSTLLSRCQFQSSFSKDSKHVSALLSLFHVDDPRVQMSVLTVLARRVPKLLLHPEVARTLLNFPFREAYLINVFNNLFSDAESRDSLYATEFNFGESRVLAIPQLLNLFAHLLDKAADPKRLTDYLAHQIMKSPESALSRLESDTEWVLLFLFFLKIDGDQELWAKVVAHCLLIQLAHQSVFSDLLAQILILCAIMGMDWHEFMRNVLNSLILLNQRQIMQFAVASSVLRFVLFVPTLPPSDFDGTCYQDFIDEIRRAPLSETVHFELLQSFDVNERLLFAALWVLGENPTPREIDLDLGSVLSPMSGVRLIAYLVRQEHQVNPMNALILLNRLLAKLELMVDASVNPMRASAYACLYAPFKDHYLFGPEICQNVE